MTKTYICAGNDRDHTFFQSNAILIPALEKEKTALLVPRQMKMIS